MTRVVLATASASRCAILKNAGVEFVARPAGIDEREIEAPLAAIGKSPAEMAMALAEAKALAVASSETDAVVIGADQVLDADGHRWHKPADLAEARDQLMTLSGRSHVLQSAIAIAEKDRIVWRHHETARMTLRRLTPEIIDKYLAEVGETVLSSVGAYQIEGPGIRLFERIEGDYFAILGLPLLPLLAFLRGKGAIA